MSFKKDIGLIEELAKRARQGARGSAEAGSHPVKSKHYIVTIKCNALKHTTKEELDQKYTNLVKKVPRAEWSDSVCYEVDKYNRTHIHTVVTIRGRIPLFKLYQVYGWSIDFTDFPMEDLTYVLSYIHKRSQSPYFIENLFYENQYMFENSFLDIDTFKFEHLDHGILHCKCPDCGEPMCLHPYTVDTDTNFESWHCPQDLE